MNERHLRLFSRLYNVRIHVYHVPTEFVGNGPLAFHSLALTDPNGVIYQGNNPQTAQDRHILWSNTLPMTEHGPINLNHFDEIMLPPEPLPYVSNSVISSPRPVPPPSDSVFSPQRQAVTVNDLSSSSIVW
jgi:hypothetical protein